MSHLPDPTSVLLAADLAPEEVARVLQAYGLQDWKRADHNLQTMAGEPEARRALANILPTYVPTALCRYHTTPSITTISTAFSGL